jgi:hypothetical protein
VPEFLVKDIERAISEISDIRSQLAASTRFRGYAPEAVAMIGFVSLGVMLAQIAWPDSLAASDSQQVLIWGAVLVASGLTMAGEAISRSRHQHGGMAGAMLKGAIRALLPICAVGVVVAAIVFLHAPEITWLLPGLWQMLVGVGVFASYSTMPRAIIWPALWFLVAGAAMMWLAGGKGHLTPLICGGPFVAGHLAIAWILYREGARIE